MKKKIHIIEDDARVSQFLKRGLLAEGYQVVVFTNGQDGMDGFFEDMPDLLILDRMLPLISGLDILQEIRMRGSSQPVLMLSAMGQVEEKIQGLKMGADDYLAKPFDFEELLARIEALLRRSAEIAVSTKTLEMNDLSLNLENLQVWRADKRIVLTAKELALLELLMSKPDKVFSRERILANVWDNSNDPLTNIVDVYIKRLRQKLNEGYEELYIQTHRGLGYSLI